MTHKNIRNKLVLKNVESKHIDQFHELLRYVFQVTDTLIEDSGYENEREIIQSKGPLLHLADVFGWFTEDDELVSQVAIYPCEVNIHGTIYNMGGLTGVGTYPEYSNFGLMKDLIIVGLQKMRDNQQWISYLYPYSIPYYKHKGWEIMSDKRTFSIRDTQLPKIVEVKGNVEREDIDHEDILKIYDEFASKNHGAMKRTPLYWEEYWRWHNEERYTAAIFYNNEEQPMGFCLYIIADEIFRIKEMIYLNQNARNGLWNFITAHFSMIDSVQGETYKNESIAFLLEDSEIKETIEPYYMARIVDVVEFLKMYPYQSTGKPFHFVVTDPLAEWNNGIFGLIWDDEDEVSITNEAIGYPVELDIQTLTAMMMSYKRPSYLAEIERLETNKETLKTLERIIPTQSAYFSDYF